jgi:hypothetical protein
MTERVYKLRDNRIDLELWATDPIDQVLKTVNITTTTRALLANGKITVDSDNDANVFDWATQGADGIIYIANLGQMNLPEGISVWRLVLFDSANPNGISWPDISIDVIPAKAAV